jgi:hypothetical protein
VWTGLGQGSGIRIGEYGDEDRSRALARSAEAYLPELIASSRHFAFSAPGMWRFAAMFYYQGAAYFREAPAHLRFYGIKE